MVDSIYLHSSNFFNQSSNNSMIIGDVEDQKLDSPISVNNSMKLEAPSSQYDSFTTAYNGNNSYLKNANSSVFFDANSKILPSLIDLNTSSEFFDAQSKILLPPINIDRFKKIEIDKTKHLCSVLNLFYY